MSLIPLSIRSALSPARDKRTSRLRPDDGGALIRLREGDEERCFRLPGGLLPLVRDRVRALCAEPAEPYVREDQWESYVLFGPEKSRISTDPGRTLALLRELAGKGELVTSERVETTRPFPMGMAPGPMGALPSVDTPRGRYCPSCGTLCSEGKFCPECGRPVG